MGLSWQGIRKLLEDGPAELHFTKVRQVLTEGLSQSLDDPTCLGSVPSAIGLTYQSLTLGNLPLIPPSGSNLRLVPHAGCHTIAAGQLLGTSMRFDGVVKIWQDERGFGFIEPSGGGQDLFVHVKAFPFAFGRPAIGTKVTFEVESGADGKKRAVKVQPLEAHEPISATSSSARRGKKSKSWETSSIIALATFAVVYLVATVVWKLPLFVGAVYLGMSIVCAGFYWHDKSAARSGAWRTSEGTLIGLGMLCGWPGAIVAQQMLRHKTTKESFRIMHWTTVVLNLALLLLASTPILRYVLNA